MRINKRNDIDIPKIANNFTARKTREGSDLRYKMFRNIKIDTGLDSG